MWGKRRSVREIQPDEIFLDSTNLPGRNDPQFEGRVVRPVSSRAMFGVGAVFAIAILFFAARAFELSVVHGEDYAEVSQENRLDRSIVFSTRGVIYDRTGKELAWNESAALSEASTTPYALRRYADLPGLSHVLGFVRYPKADASGNWWRTEYSGVAGSEQAFNDALAGLNGSRMVEIDALGNVEMQNIIEPPVPGRDITLSIDAEIQSKLFSALSTQARAQGFEGGAAVIMDVRTGELLALTSFPEYDNAGFTEGDAAAIDAAHGSDNSPLLDRATSGLYAPGSIVKPIFAAAALNEGIISPEKKIQSTGAITIPNPYNPDNPSIFRDWTVHGWIDMREAIAVSSDEYFYTIGGGFGSQVGLGIARLDEYARDFGLGTSTGFTIFGEEVGVIPTPEWKEKVFGEDDPWRIGNTYHTAIGQFGFQITPLQAVRFVAAIGNGGKLLTPQILAGAKPEYTSVGVPDEYLQIVREGMRLAVTSTRSDATVKSLSIPGIQIAAKTGTAQIGTQNQYMNSWSIGFWPADNPHYAYAVVLEKARAGTLSGAAPGFRPFVEWLIANRPEYIE
ncbi:MAG: hypothetical protein HYS26_02685 [Candidatus Kaiserbacteria bacterium]|nr:MAG: hypothetical protein HYS26_02685 [Candidatus Kaiserbacteria bacterium]